MIISKSRYLKGRNPRMSSTTTAAVTTSTSTRSSSSSSSSTELDSEIQRELNQDEEDQSLYTQMQAEVRVAKR
jgi:hypothetical protein